VPIVDLPDAAAPPRRRIVLSGPLDTAAAMRLAGELMELDGRSADAVELVINSDGGPLADVLGLLDVVASMRAPVDTACLGRATGTAAVLLACGTGTRRAGPHATMSLRCDRSEHLEGTAAALRTQLDDLEHVHRAVVDALARATGREVDELGRHLDDGTLLDRDAATAFGILDPQPDA
jgi:ATP-dependent Clp protease protease subunit